MTSMKGYESRKSSKSSSCTYPTGKGQDSLSAIAFRRGFEALQGPHHVAENVTMQVLFSDMKSERASWSSSSVKVMVCVWHKE